MSTSTIRTLEEQVKQAKLNYTISKKKTEELELIHRNLAIQLQNIQTNIPISMWSNQNTDSGETKQELNPRPKFINLTYLGKHLIQPLHHDVPQRCEDPQTLWNTIFSFLPVEYSKCRRLCKLFHASLDPLPTWTVYPHPKFSTLRALLQHLNQLITSTHDAAATIEIPQIVFVQDGHYTMDTYEDEWEDEYNDVDITCSIQLIGASKRRENCVIEGGLVVLGAKTNKVVLKHLTITDSKANGVLGNDGGAFELDNVLITHCRNGIWSYNTTARLNNCEISHCRRSGMSSGKHGVTIVSGQHTRVHHNATKGDSSSFGLRACDANSLIQIMLPLTKEISKNNTNGNNYGGTGTIRVVA